MTMDKKSLLKEANYYYITDEDSKVPLVQQVKTAVKKGVKIIQYRKKSGTDREMYEEVKKAKGICDDEALLIVNDRVDVALAADADGVHLGQDDLPAEEVRGLAGDLLIGVSTHEMEEVEEVQLKADYIAVGPVHETKTKTNTADELGVEKAKEIARTLQVPTAAIGGVEETDLESLCEVFDMVCAISSVTRKGELSERIDHFEKKIEECKRRERR
ncbi:MAG: thiamine phosphate synthase [Candidatus Aenigmatarchaeota archaeon]